jgi:hypothetical protein
MDCVIDANSLFHESPIKSICNLHKLSMRGSLSCVVQRALGIPGPATNTVLHRPNSFNSRTSFNIIAIVEKSVIDCSSGRSLCPRR